MIRLISQFSFNKAVEQRIKNAAKHAVLGVGIGKDAEYPNGVKVETVAFRQEFGDGNVPPRPFVRTTVVNKKQDWAESAERKFAKVLKPNSNGSAKTALRALGEEMVEDIKRGIEDVVAPPLNPSTVKSKNRKGRKRPDKPLVDSGLLKDSIKAEVTEG